MLKTQFDPNRPLRFVRYGRMSSDRQNRRSPEQQFATIAETIASKRYRWQHVADYRDDAISGKWVRKRPGLQRLRQDIRSGRLIVDAILVDTFERFGRADEMTEIRRQLRNRHGVMVLTADSGFQDPDTVAGRATNFVEGVRATTGNTVKSHDVSRGKRDAARQLKWPGGNAPFGYRLESVLHDVKGRQEVDYSRLVPNPSTAWIVRLLFEKARDTGWGATRLARFLNDRPDVPEDLKPFVPAGVAYCLKSAIYRGQFVWERVSKGIIDDTHVTQRNDEASWLVVDDFCEPIVTAEVWQEVQTLRLARALRGSSARGRASEKSIRPLTPGLVLKYPLTGLVRCDDCGRTMTPHSNKVFVTKSGDARRYVRYVCPAGPSGACANKRGVDEAWLRAMVFKTLLKHLFFGDSADGAERA